MTHILKGLNSRRLQVCSLCSDYGLLHESFLAVLLHSNEENMDAEGSSLSCKAMDKLRAIPGIGLIMALMSGVLFSISSFAVEFTDQVSPCFIVIFMSIMQLFLFIPYSLFTKESFSGVQGERLLVILRSCFGYTSYTLGYLALLYVSFSDTQSIQFSAPVYASFFACVILHEACGLFQVICVIVTLLGVFMISRPSFIFGVKEEDTFTTQDRIIGLSLSFIVSISMSLTYITLRKLERTPTSVLIVWYSLFNVIVGVITVIVWFFVSPESLIPPRHQMDWLMMTLNGCLNAIAQIFLVLSLKLEEARLVSLMRTFDIVVAFVLQVSLSNQPVFWESIVGAVIISSSCVSIALRKYFNAISNSHYSVEDQERNV